MELSFINTDIINFYAWFMGSIKTIYGIDDLPSTSKGLNSYDGGHEIVHAFCDTEFNNWDEDPMASNACQGNVFRFRHKDSHFTVKFHVSIDSSMIGPLNTGMLCLSDEDPNKEQWIAQLKRIIPNLKEQPRRIQNCTKTCQILNRYWGDAEMN
jgi:hypothetical protein